MYPIPIGSNAILDPVSFSAAFTSEMTFGFAAWLAVAAAAYLALLPLALRRGRVVQIERVARHVELREAA